MSAKWYPVVWVRHAQSVGNVERRFAHRVYDPPLTSLGLAQAEALAAALTVRAELTGLEIFCSPSLRTQQTAASVARATAGRVSLDEGLREINSGELDGSTEPEAREIVEDLKAQWARGELDVAYPGGDSLRTVLSRMYGSLLKVAHAAERSPTLVVGHGGSLRLFARRTVPLCEQGRITKLANASISKTLVTLRSDGFGLRIATWNETRHLAHLAR